jgi:preprotein translocase subunit SecG
MMKGNTILIVALALVAFMFMKNSSTTNTTATISNSNNPVSNIVASVVTGLVSIFGKSNSAYSAGNIEG